MPAVGGRTLGYPCVEAPGGAPSWNQPASRANVPRKTRSTHKKVSSPSKVYTMANLLYVDNSNVWIEGMRVAAVQGGTAPDILTAMRDNIIDYGWKLDFGRLFEFAGGQKAEVKRAVLYGSRPPRNDSLWASASAKGFEVVVHGRNAQNKEKKIDVNIATDIVADSYEILDPETDVITLVSGDKDYVPTVDCMRKRGITFEVVFWDHAAAELKSSSSRFVSLNPHLNLLRLR